MSRSTPKFHSALVDPPPELFPSRRLAGSNFVRNVSRRPADSYCTSRAPQRQLDAQARRGYIDAMQPLPARGSVLEVRYVRAPEPLVFPEQAEMPESQLHLDLRTLLYHLLRDHLGDRYTVGSEQFVYWDAADPRKCLSPDAYVRATPAGAPVQTWKTWERGAPDVAVEIISESDAGEPAWQEKLGQYRALGVRELVRFDPRMAVGPRLRVWDRVAEDLVERALDGNGARSLVLDLQWCVAPAEGYDATLRIARGEPPVLLPTREEARVTAERRVAELEAELARRGS